MNISKTSAIAFYRGGPQEEALARLGYAVENGLRGVLLSGASGVGKSTLIADFARSQRRLGQLVAVANVTEPRQLLWSIASQWGLFPEREATLFSLWLEITDRLAQLPYEGRSAIIALDPLTKEAEAAILLRRLSECQSPPGERLTFIGAIETSALATVPKPIAELVDLRIELEPWDEADTAAAVAKENFTSDAVEDLYALTSGIARQVGRLTRFASLAAAAEQLNAIDTDTLVAVREELLIV